jgi:methylated-DNA-[protein]-cysteine S-methyltransferase
MTTYATTIDSPVGPLSLQLDETVLTRVTWGECDGADHGRFGRVVEQLDEFFAGDRRTFDIPLALVGTDFQRRVWRALQEIPYGQTRTYAEIADAIGAPSAVRAVGGANNRNPIAIVVPCHRVIGADGSLTGFGGGLEAKRWLLDHEQHTAGLALF